MRSRKMRAAKTGVSGTNRPVMKPVLVTEAFDRPKVCSA
jgi:hypothetical protein